MEMIEDVFVFNMIYHYTEPGPGEGPICFCFLFRGRLRSLILRVFSITDRFLDLNEGRTRKNVENSIKIQTNKILSKTTLQY